MSGMKDDLPDELIIECAERLGAFKVPLEDIKSAWRLLATYSSYGCLNNDNGKRLFVAYRLREMGCFQVGCQSEDEIGSGCIFHFFDLFYNARNLTDAEFAAFMSSTSTRESDVAATKLWKLIDAHPVNAVAGRVAPINKDNRT